MNRIFICIAAYNEERTILKTLKFLENSLKQIRLKQKPVILVGLNGCSDNTKDIVARVKQTYKFPLKIVNSSKGKLRAHKEMIKHVEGQGSVLFLDADVLVPSSTIESIISCLDQNPKLKIVSAYPYVLKPSSLKGIKKFTYYILNLKRILPKIEIAKEDVTDYHGAEIKDNFLKKSRIYFHGRCFAIRNKGIYAFPAENSLIRGDDTFLSFAILKKQPRQSVKVLYDAPVYSYPEFSFANYLRAWHRIRKDLDNIYEEYPEFLEIGKKTEMIINWDYVIKELSFSYKIYALGFFILKKFEAASYALFKKKIDIDKLWSYSDKSAGREK